MGRISAEVSAVDSCSASAPHRSDEGLKKFRQRSTASPCGKTQVAGCGAKGSQFERGLGGPAMPLHFSAHSSDQSGPDQRTFQ